MVGTFSEKSRIYLNKIANTFSDMGFDVDISPVSNSAHGLATNALENDVDALLLLSDSYDIEDKMVELEHFLDRKKAEILLLCSCDNGERTQILKERSKNWIILKSNANRPELGVFILNQLLNRTENK